MENGKWTNGNIVVGDRQGKGTITYNGTADLTETPSFKLNENPLIKDCGKIRCCEDKDCRPSCSTNYYCVREISAVCGLAGLGYGSKS